jgi:hypothetical protein
LSNEAEGKNDEEPDPSKVSADLIWVKEYIDVAMYTLTRMDNSKQQTGGA